MPVSERPTRLALRPREAAKALGISPRKLWELTRDGEIPCRRVGHGKRQMTLYPLEALQGWLGEESQATQSPPDGCKHPVRRAEP